MSKVLRKFSMNKKASVVENATEVTDGGIISVVSEVEEVGAKGSTGQDDVSAGARRSKSILNLSYFCACLPACLLSF